MKLGTRGNCRERVWAAMRELREFRAADLAAAADVPEGTARFYIHMFKRGGLVEVAIPSAPGSRVPGIFALIHDPGERAPWIVGDARAHKPTGVRSRIWQSMRVLRRFTVPDLAATAEVSEDRAREFVRWLHRIGYLRQLRHATGNPGGHALYQLVRDTGPKPVRVGRDGIYDPNTRDFFPWQPEETEQ